MKNLKRLLSLALTGVMLVGMMAIGASAVEYKDFTDISEIENTEAVSTMVVLGVINGKDDGSFDPTGSVTRAEMAKMITVTLFGGADPKLGTTASGSFTDTRGNWAESYIEYCSSQGIIAGLGNGTFNPAGQVTGQQAAKMLLVTIGRNADAFGYVGNDWALNTMGDAITMGLFDNLADVDPSAPLTREDAAQMIYNALDVVLWERVPNLNLSTGVVTNGYGENSKGDTLLTAKFKVETSYGILTTVDEGDLEITETATGGVPGYKGTNGNETQFADVAADYSGLLGQSVKVLYKEVKGENVVLGVAPLAINKTVTANMNDIEPGTGNNSAKIKVNGKTLTLSTVDAPTDADNKIIQIIDGVEETTTSNYWTVANFTNKGTSTQKVTLVDNDNDNRYEYAVVTNVSVEKVIYTSSTSIITTSTYTYEDDTIPAGLEKGDYVAVSKNLFTGEHTLEKIDAIETKINGTKGAGTAADPKQFLMDGTWYKVGGTLTNGPAVGDTAKVFIINGVIVAGEKVEGESGSINDVAIVLDAEKVDGTNNTLFNIHAKLMFADGSVQTVVINKNNSAEPGDFVTYTEKNGTYTLKVMATADAPEATGYTWVDGAANDVKDEDGSTNTAKKVATIGGLGIADDAVIYLVTDTEDDDGNLNATIITGAELKTINTNKFDTQSLGSYYTKSNGLNKVAIAALTVSGKTLPGVGSNDTRYGYIVSDAYQSASKKVTYTIWNGSENVVVTETLDANVTSSDLTARKAGTFLTFGDVNGDGEILNADVDAATTLTLTVGAVQGITGSNKITLDGSTETEILKDAAYLYIDSSVSDKLELGKVAGELVPATEMVDGVFVENILYAVDGDGKISVIVIDVKNKISKAFGATQLGADSNTTSTNVSALTFKETDGTVLGTTKVLAGDAVTLEYTLEADAGDDATITLTNAKFADGTNELALAGVEAGTYTVSIYPYANNFKAVAADS